MTTSLLHRREDLSAEGELGVDGGASYLVSTTAALHVCTWQSVGTTQQKRSSHLNESNETIMILLSRFGEAK